MKPYLSYPNNTKFSGFVNENNNNDNQIEAAIRPQSQNLLFLTHPMEGS